MAKLFSGHTFSEEKGSVSDTFLSWGLLYSTAVRTHARTTQVIDACNRFNGRHPVKGMPPGVYAEEDGGSFYGFGRAPAVLILTMVSLITFAGYKAVKNMRRRRNAGRGSDGEWLAESDRQVLSAQVRR